MRMKDHQIVKILGGALTTRKKEEDRLHDLEENPLFPPEVPSRATAGRAAKHDLQDENRRRILKQFSIYQMNHQK